MNTAKKVAKYIITFFFCYLQHRSLTTNALIFLHHAVINYVPESINQVTLQ